LKTNQYFTFDLIDYKDVRYLLSAVKLYFDQYYNLIIPFIELLNKDVLNELNKISNVRLGFCV